MGAKRGDIWAIQHNEKTKLAIIVSDDSREDSKLLSGIILTENAYDTNAEFYTKEGLKYANPNAVTTIANTRLVDWCRSASASEMQRLDEKIVKALGLEEYMEDKFGNGCKVDVVEPQDAENTEYSDEHKGKPFDVSDVMRNMADVETIRKLELENASLRGKLEAVKELLDKYLKP